MSTSNVLKDFSGEFWVRHGKRSTYMHQACCQEAQAKLEDEGSAYMLEKAKSVFEDWSRRAETYKSTGQYPSVSNEEGCAPEIERNHRVHSRFFDGEF